MAGAIDVVKDFHEAEENEGRSMHIDDDDMIEDIRFASDGQTFRIYINRKSAPFYVDYNLQEMTPDFERFSFKYEDKSVFRLQMADAGAVDYQANLQDFLQEYKDHCTFAFPDKEPGTVVALSTDELPERYFYIYNVYKNQRTRKILKKDIEFQQVDDDNAFSDDPE